VDDHLTLTHAPDVLTIPELCAILRIGRNQAYTLVNSGRLGRCRIGNSVRIPKAAVERLLEVPMQDAAASEGGADGALFANAD
jgi:excisionase family DNA binding protein